jgi:hypothetical protein
LHESVPGGGGFRSDQALDQRAVFLQQLADGGGDVFGLNGIEAGQAAEIEQGVHSGIMGVERETSILGRRQQNARAAKPRHPQCLFDKFLVGVEAGMAEPGHDQDQADQGRGETETGQQHDDDGP